MRQLENLTVDQENEKFCSIDNIIYSIDMTLLHTCAPNKKTPFNIPQTIKSFATEAFRTVRQTVEFSVPSQVTELPMNCFFDSYFSSIILPENLKVIGDYSMRHTHIKSIKIPKTVTDITSNAFLDSQVQHVYFQTYEQTVTISQYSFGNCIYLKTIHIPQKGIVFASNSVFDGCINLKKVYYIVQLLTFSNIFGPDVKFNAHISSNNEPNVNSHSPKLCGDILDIRMSTSSCYLSVRGTCNKIPYIQIQNILFVIFYFS